MKDLKEALTKVEWPNSTEVSGKFALVIIILISLIIFIAAIDGLLGYLLGYIY